MAAYRSNRRGNGRPIDGISRGISAEGSGSETGGHAQKAGVSLGGFSLEAEGRGGLLFVFERDQLKRRLIGRQRAQQPVVNGMT